MGMRKHEGKFFRGITIVAMIVIWQLFALFSDFTVVRPIPELVSAFGDILLHKTLYIDIYTSLKAILLGILFAILLGGGLACLCWLSKPMRYVSVTVTTFIKAIPCIGMIPFFIAIFGISITGRVVVIMLTGFPVMFFNMLTAIDDESKRSYVEASKLDGATDVQSLIHIIIPNTFTTLVTSLKLCVSYSIISTIASEMFGASSGIGYRVQSYNGSFAYAKMTCYLVIMSLLSWVIQTILEKILIRLEDKV